MKRMLMVVIMSVLPIHSVWAQCTSVGIVGEFKRPSTGTSQPYGVEIQRGVDIAFEYLNNRKRKTCLTYRLLDINNSIANIPDVILQAEKEGIHLFLGLGISNQALMALEPLRKTKSVLITPTASSDELNNSQSRIITLYPLNTQIAEVLTQNLRARGVSQVAILYATNDKYSTNIANHFKRRFIKYGGDIPIEIPLRAGMIDDNDDLNSLAHSDVTHIFIPLFELDVAKLISQLNKMGINKEYVGSDSWGTYYLTISKMTSNVHFHAILPRIYSPDFKGITNSYFVDSYIKRFNISPTDLSAFSFEGLLLYDEMLNKCGLDQIRTRTSSCIASVLPFNSTTGRITHSNNLNMVRNIKVYDFIHAAQKYE